MIAVGVLEQPVLYILFSQTVDANERPENPSRQQGTCNGTLSRARTIVLVLEPRATIGPHLPHLQDPVWTCGTAASERLRQREYVNRAHVWPLGRRLVRTGNQLMEDFSRLPGESDLLCRFQKVLNERVLVLQHPFVSRPGSFAWGRSPGSINRNRLNVTIDCVLPRSQQLSTARPSASM